MTQPLAGIRVADFSHVMAGPYASHLLRLMGAEVIKIEPPGHGEAARGPKGTPPGGIFHVTNRNKMSVALDLKQPEGLAAARRLIADSQVLVESFRPGVLARLGLGWEQARAINPALIYCSISDYGRTGPAADKGGFDLIAQGVSGLMSITGEPGRGPMRVGIPIDDLTAGNLLALGVVMKLYDRERTGRGGYVHTSLLESQVFMLDFQASRYLMDSEVAGQAGNDHPVNIPMGVFPTADKPINIAASSPKLWEAFCRAAGREDWMQVPEWQTASGRSKDRARVNATISEVTRTKPSEWWIETLEAAGIPCGPINNIREVFEDPQVQHLEMAMPIRHRRRGDTHVVASPLNVEGLDTGVYRDVPD